MTDGAVCKRFMLFAGHNYYPCGGIDDFIDSFDTVDRALGMVLENSSLPYPDAWEWYQVFDRQAGETVEEGETRDLIREEEE